MKKNLINKLLLILVLGIWLWVAWRYFFADIQDSKSQKSFTKSHVSGILQGAAKEPYDLRLDYRDPFLGEVQAEKPTGSKVERRPGIHQVRKLKAQKLPPSVSLLGMVRRNESTPKTAIISWNGNTLSVSPGDSIQGMKILELGDQYLSIWYGDTTWKINF